MNPLRIPRQHLREVHTDGWRDRRKLVARSRRTDLQWRHYTLQKSWDPARRSTFTGRSACICNCVHIHIIIYRQINNMIVVCCIYIISHTQYIYTHIIIYICTHTQFNVDIVEKYSFNMSKRSVGVWLPRFLKEGMAWSSKRLPFQVFRYLQWGCYWHYQPKLVGGIPTSLKHIS